MTMTVENRVGRLVEVYIDAKATLDELRGFRTKMYTLLSKTPGGVVGCTDMRDFVRFLPEVAKGIVEMLSNDTPRVARNAIFLGGNKASTVVHVETLIRDANELAATKGHAAPNRRTFRARDAMLAWLDEVLSPSERERAHLFLR